MDRFKSTIKEYLDKRAAEDERFRERYSNPNKSIDECSDYIIGEVRNSHREAFSDNEIYGLAVHYYDEDNVVIDSGAKNGLLAIASPGEITDEDRNKAKQMAIEEMKKHEIEKIREKQRRMPKRPKEADNMKQLELEMF